MAAVSLWPSSFSTAAELHWCYLQGRCMLKVCNNAAGRELPVWVNSSVWGDSSTAEGLTTFISGLDTWPDLTWFLFSVLCIVVLKLLFRKDFCKLFYQRSWIQVPVWTGCFHRLISYSCFRKVSEPLPDLLTWHSCIAGHCFNDVWPQHIIGKSVLLFLFFWTGYDCKQHRVQLESSRKCSWQYAALWRCHGLQLKRTNQ